MIWREYKKNRADVTREHQAQMTSTDGDGPVSSCPAAHTHAAAHGDVNTRAGPRLRLV